MNSAEREAALNNLRIGTAHGDAFAVALVVADALRGRGVIPDVSMLDRGQRATAFADGTVEILIDYVEADVDGRPKQPVGPDGLLAAFTLGHVLVVPTRDAGLSATADGIKAFLADLATDPDSRLATTIPPLARTPVIAALRELTGVGLTAQSFTVVHERHGLRHVLDRELAVGALLTTTDPTLHTLAHDAWPIPTETTHRVVVHIGEVGADVVATVDTLLSGLTESVMQQLIDDIGDSVLQGAEKPGTSRVSQLTQHLLRPGEA